MMIINGCLDVTWPMEVICWVGFVADMWRKIVSTCGQLLSQNLPQRMLGYRCGQLTPGYRVWVVLMPITLLNTFDCPLSGGKPANLARAWTYDL
jgi:hypothetical protein